jgi:hypothetical protein
MSKPIALRRAHFPGLKQRQDRRWIEKGRRTITFNYSLPH